MPNASWALPTGRLCIRQPGGGSSQALARCFAVRDRHSPREARTRSPHAALSARRALLRLRRSGFSAAPLGLSFAKGLVMRSSSAFALFGGVAAGFLLVRERHSRQASERLAAAALETLLNAIDANDAQTGHHARRVAKYALILADAAGLREHEIREVERVALFHDVGKIHEALFDIIHEHARLTTAERRAIDTHPRRGFEVLAPLTPFYPDLAEGVLSHHERWDGKGYPRGLKGRHIPLTARIVMLADTFDAITHDRRYRGEQSIDQAVRAIAEGRGTQFDPELVDLTLLPPVLAGLRDAHRKSLKPKLRRGNRRGGREERHTPDLTFRWRSEWLGSPSRDRLPQRSR